MARPSMVFTQIAGRVGQTVARRPPADGPRNGAVMWRAPDISSALNPRKLLLIEDDPGLVLTLIRLLAEEHYAVHAVSDGEEGMALALTAAFDLILLSAMPPGMSGFEICRTLRRRAIETPIVMLTARSEVDDRVLGLRLGADDCLAKPFAVPELLARIEAVLRRGNAAGGTHPRQIYQFDSVVVDLRSTEVRKDGQRVRMSAREFELLCYLIENRGATISRTELLREVWGYDPSVVTRTIDVHVGLLRQKLEVDPADPRHFITVRGLGYKFSGSDGAQSEA